MNTIRDVAARADVSITTVSHVLNHTRPVSAELRKRVLAAVEALDYKPNQLARSLRLKQTRTIGMLIPDNANPFFAEIAKQIEKHFFLHGYSVILCNTDGSFEKERFYAGVLAEKQADGIVFAATSPNPEILFEIRQRNIPVVVIDRLMPDLAIDTILVDNVQGGYLAMQHLLELGHTRIGYIGRTRRNPGSARLDGYRKALRQAGFRYDPHLVRDGDFKVDTGLTGTRALLALPDPPTAIFAGNDLIAIGAVHAAREAGMEVPGDLSVIGFDDIPLARYFSPALSTIAQPLEKLGALTSQVLVDRIHNPSTDPVTHVLDVRLIQRDSTRPRRTQDCPAAAMG